MLRELIEEDPKGAFVSLTVICMTIITYHFVIYPLYFHPLSKVPGPKICAMTKYFILFKSWNEERNRYIQALHEKYGDIVRIGPNAVDICDARYLKDIYVDNMDKSGFYAQFVNYEQPNTFSITSKKEHIASRKTSNKFYSKSNVCSAGIINRVEKVVEDTLSVIERFENVEINVFMLFCDMAMDAVTSFTFGSENYESLLADPFGFGAEVVTDFSIQSSLMFWVTEMPEWLNWVISNKVAEASDKCFEFIDRQFARAMSQLSQTEESGEETLLGVYFDSRSTNDPRQKIDGFTPIRTKSEFFDHIAAGHVTTSTTLSYLFYELAKHPEMQVELQQELSRAGNSHNVGLVPFNVIDDELTFPYMHAVIKETFRIHAAIPGQEPRVVSCKGLLWRGESGVSESTVIPGKTTVSMQPWSLHRNKNVFYDAEVFEPRRWIDCSEDELKLMLMHMMHFGAGSRMCIGKNLALAEIELVVCNLMMRYNVELVDGWDYENESAMMDIYTTVPKSEKMMLKFVKRV